MRFKRVMAVVLAGMLALTSSQPMSLKAYAADVGEDDVISADMNIEDETVEADSYVSDTEQEPASGVFNDEAEGSENTTDEASVVDEPAVPGEYTGEQISPDAASVFPDDPETWIEDTAVMTDDSEIAEMVTVVFDANGGVFDGDEVSRDISVEKNTSISAAPVPVRTDYDFDGWFLDSEGSSKVDPATYSFTENITLYAGWIKSGEGTYELFASSVTVTLDANGGVHLDTGTSIATVVVPVGTSLAEADTEYYLWNVRPKPEDCKSIVNCEKWSLDEQGNEPIDDLYDFKPTKDCTIYAQWTPVYTVSFDAGGGTLPDGSQTAVFKGVIEGTTLTDDKRSNTEYGYVDYGVEPYEVPGNPQYDGYAFDGWFTDSEYTDGPYNYRDIDKYIINTDTTFIAKYSEAYSVTFHGNGGSFASYPDDESVIVPVAKDRILGAAAPVITGTDGDAFTGWYTDSNLSLESRIDPYKFVVDKDKIHLYAGFESDACWKITFRSGNDDVAFTDGNQETVVYVRKGEPLTYGVGSIAKVNSSPVIEYGDDAKKTGKVPSGYWELEGSDDKYYFSFMGGFDYRVPHVIKESGEYPNLPTSGFVPCGDMTFTAEWVDAVKITLIPQKGQFSAYYYIAGPERYLGDDPYFELEYDDDDDEWNPVKIIYTAYKGIPLNNFKRYMPSAYYKDATGKYQTASWGYSDPECTKKINDSQPIESDTTIYGKMAASSGSSSYTIRFHAGEGYFDDYDGNHLDLVTRSVAGWNSNNFYYLVAYTDDENKAFAGWFYDEQLKKPYPYEKLTSGRYMMYFPSKVTDLYAKFETACTVGFDANGGYFDEVAGEYNVNPDEIVRSDSYKEYKVVAGKMLNVTDISLRLRIDSNVLFAGWYLDPDCTQKAKITVNDTAGNDFYKVTENTTLYAKWVKYTPADEGITLSPDNLDLDIGAKGRLSLVVPEGVDKENVKWRISAVSFDNNTNKAFILPAVVDNDGNVMGQAAGTIKVVAEINGIRSNEVTVNVSSKTVESSITLSTEETVIRTTDEAVITATVTPESLESQPFVWTTSNDKVITVEGTSTIGSIKAVGPGTANITAKVGSISKSIAITVVDPVVADKESVYLTLVEGAKETIVATVKGHPELKGKKDGEVLTAKVCAGDGETESDFAEITSLSGEYGTDSGTFTISVSPKAVGEGLIVLTTARGYTAYIYTVVSEREHVMDVDIYGYDSAEAGEGVDGIISNGWKIHIDTQTRGANISYVLNYSDKNDFGPVDKGMLTETYVGPVLINDSHESGFMQIAALAEKDSLEDSGISVRVLKLDNDGGKPWLDVAEVDRSASGPFYGDFTKVPGSGLVVSIGGKSQPFEKAYTGEKITLEYSDIPDESEIRVYYNGRYLRQGTDYKVAYSNNVNASKSPDEFAALSDSDKDKLKLPKVTITLTGSYTGKKAEYFVILARDISADCIRVTSASLVTASIKDKKFNPAFTLVQDLENGKTKTLKKGTDYDIFYNRMDENGNIDYTERFNTFDEIKADFEEGENKDKRYNYVINAEGLFLLNGKGNYVGVLANDTQPFKAPFLQIISENELNDGMLQLDKAKLSKKIPAQQYEKDDKGNAKNKAEDVIALFAANAIRLKIGKTELTYLPDDKAETAQGDGYYFTIDDPGAGDDFLNHCPCPDNHVIVRPTDMGEESEVINKLVGALRVDFTINGRPIGVNSVRSSIEYDGEPLLVYEEYGLNYAESLKRIADSKAGTAGAQVYAKNGRVQEDLDPDDYYFYAQNDFAQAGTVTVIFEGKAEKGVTGKVTKKIKVTPKKISAKSLGGIKAEFADKDNPGFDPDDIPYAASGAKPEVIVRDGERELDGGYDFTVSYSGNTKVGSTGKVNIKFKGNYSGTWNSALTFKVGKALFSDANLYAESADKAYKAKASKNYFKSVPDLYSAGKKLKLKTDYTYVSEPVYFYAEDYNKNGIVRYANTPIPDTEVVPAGVLVRVIFSALPTAKSSFKAMTEEENKEVPEWFEATYRIGSENISKAKVTIKDQPYADGEEIIPSKNDIEVTLGGKILTSSDYKIISITNNVKAGKATMVIRGDGGEYFGTKKVTFKIVKGTFKE